MTIAAKVEADGLDVVACARASVKGRHLLEYYDHWYWYWRMSALLVLAVTSVE